VLALDWLGWGESERSLDLRFDYDTEVARLGCALDALGLDECNLFGHDQGGFLSLGFSDRSPGRVLRLAILNSRAHGSFVTRWYAIFSITSLLGRSPFAAAATRLLPLGDRLGRRGRVPANDHRDRARGSDPGCGADADPPHRPLRDGGSARAGERGSDAPRRPADRLAEPAAGTDRIDSKGGTSGAGRDARLSGRAQACWFGFEDNGWFGTYCPLRGGQ
jgi:pimeloyl-ACP methyl ester carboxylesterase